jgi:hypothetical protein
MSENHRSLPSEPSSNPPPGEQQTASQAAAIEQWEQWMPMDKRLFQAVQNLHLCMLQKLDEMLNKANIEYWICGGTLMGAIRHSGRLGIFFYLVLCFFCYLHRGQLS